MRLFNETETRSMDFCASEGLRDDLEAALKELPIHERVFVAFAYTNYGGDWLDVVATKYFEEEYGSKTLVENTVHYGKNCLVIGPIAREWSEETERYLLGFRDFEEYFSIAESDQFDNDMREFLADLDKYSGFVVRGVETCMKWLHENKFGHFNITTQGVDFRSEELEQELLEQGLIERCKE